MPTSEWDATLYDQKHAFVSDYGKSLLALLEPQAGEVILDLGCGTGHLAHEIAQSGAHVVGIDSSARMIEKALASYPDLEFHIADGRNFHFPYQFDAIFSNAALHWIPEPTRVAQCMARALKPGGRLVAEFGGKGNVAAIISSVQQAITEITQRHVESGWYFPSIGEYASLLEEHGLTVRNAALFTRPTKLEDGEQGFRTWLQMFCHERMLNQVAEQDRAQVINRAEALAREKLFKADEGNWYADYVRLRVIANR